LQPPQVRLPRADLEIEIVLAVWRVRLSETRKSNEED
jgi:hypothetical protein